MCVCVSLCTQDRIKNYMVRLKQAKEPESGAPQMTLNQDAAKRFITAALASNKPKGAEAEAEAPAGKSAIKKVRHAGCSPLGWVRTFRRVLCTAVGTRRRAACPPAQIASTRTPVQRSAVWGWMVVGGGGRGLGSLTATPTPTARHQLDQPACCS